MQPAPDPYRLESAGSTGSPGPPGKEGNLGRYKPLSFGDLSQGDTGLSFTNTTDEPVIDSFSSTMIAAGETVTLTNDSIQVLPSIGDGEKSRVTRLRVNQLIKHEAATCAFHGIGI